MPEDQLQERAKHISQYKQNIQQTCTTDTDKDRQRETDRQTDRQLGACVCQARDGLLASLRMT